ncbi:hypothetical protein FXO38_34175 [Capsicum annuum]|uniref:Amine oxidase domain-containing protein n=1 Tax=Capsicum annuum TaxID=4072 RepID=A0A2G3AGJ9_CAPAN|nr:hypothetical protein FXO38_34175 [Capsicum annuum]KAF3620060.1 hypothetical protein FXO37_33426 [Capsicum annuum]PHT93371.1 hypothetical protein T459_01253 [Capsicum annuum]
MNGVDEVLDKEFVDLSSIPTKDYGSMIRDIPNGISVNNFFAINDDNGQICVRLIKVCDTYLTGVRIRTLLCYSCDLVEKPSDACDRLRAPISNLFFRGETVSSDYHQGSVQGAYEAGIMAGESCHQHLIKRHGSLEMVQAVSYSDDR